MEVKICVNVIDFQKMSFFTSKLNANNIIKNIRKRSFDKVFDQNFENTYRGIVDPEIFFKMISLTKINATCS